MAIEQRGQLAEGIENVQIAKLIIEDKEYELAKWKRAIVIPNPAPDQAIILFNNQTGALVLAQDRDIPTIKEIRAIRPNRLVVIDMLAHPIRIDLNVRSSTYTSFFHVQAKIMMRVKNGRALFEKYRNRLDSVKDELGEIIGDEVFTDVRSVARRFAPNEYGAFEAALTEKVRIGTNSNTVFSDDLDFGDIRFMVSLSHEQEKMMIEATLHEWEQAAEMKKLDSDVKLIKNMSDLLGSIDGADLILAVTRKEITLAQAVEKLIDRKQKGAESQIRNLDIMIKNGIMHENTAQGYGSTIFESGTAKQQPRQQSLDYGTDNGFTADEVPDEGKE
jgi:hypothetical protein